MLLHGEYLQRKIICLFQTKNAFDYLQLQASSENSESVRQSSPSESLLNDESNTESVGVPSSHAGLNESTEISSERQSSGLNVSNAEPEEASPQSSPVESNIPTEDSIVGDQPGQQSSLSDDESESDAEVSILRSSDNEISGEETSSDEEVSNF